MTPEIISKTYKALPTIKKFHASNKFIRGIMGPVGCGKTVGCIMEIFTRCCEQFPNENGVRKSRWALIRNTYPELLSTTLKTFEEWIPPELCRVTRGAVICGTIRHNLSDGTRVEAEIIFMSCDREEDVKKMKSLELTGVFINEASEIIKPVFDMATARVRRYPAGGRCKWTGVIMDTNPPDDTHWWYHLAEVERPSNHEFWRQPPAMIRIPGKEAKDPPTYVPNDGSYGVPRAENVENYADGFLYWIELSMGKSEEFLKVYVLGEYGTLMSGKPVYPEYSDTVHYANEELEPYGGLSLLLCWDFGLTPSCVFLQSTPRGQVRAIDELVSEDMGIERFARDIVIPHLANQYSGFSSLGVGDPAGGARSQSDETTCFEVLQSYGLRAEPAPSNSFQIRREAVAWFLTKLTDGNPGFLLSSKCPVLRKGFLSKYHYRKIRVANSDRYTETPEKNSYSHPHDALQYGCSFLRSGARGGNSDFSIGMRPARRPVKIVSAAGWT